MNEQNNDLLAQQIRATNRATRAIRALVRFLLVQLLFITGAALLIFFGELTVGDSVECTLYGDECGARPVFQLFAALTFLVGVIISSRIAWAELALSDPGLESNPHPKNILSAPEFEPGTEFPKSQTSYARWGDSSPASATEPCPKCKSRISLGSKFCTNCGTRFAN